MNTYNFVKFVAPSGGVLNGLKVGDVIFFPGKTKLQVGRILSARIKSTGETFSWDKTVSPIAVRRDT